MDAQIVRETLLETLFEMFGTEKKFELEDYVKSLSDEQVLALAESFAKEENSPETEPRKSDDSAVDEFVTTLIRNMNQQNISTSDQIKVIDGTLSAIKKGTLTITKKENE